MKALKPDVQPTIEETAYIQSDNWFPAKLMFEKKYFYGSEIILSTSDSKQRICEQVAFLHDFSVKERKLIRSFEMNTLDDYLQQPLHAAEYTQP